MADATRGATPRSVHGRVPFPVPAEVAFDYLSDPRHRAEWQSSLARVVEIDGGSRDGQTWVDVTRPGLRPRMRTTAFDRPRRWSESGTWRFVRADLTLDFEDAPGDDAAAIDPGCVVAYRFRLHVLGPVGLAASYLSQPAVAADLKRAARVLAAAQRDSP